MGTAGDRIAILRVLFSGGPADGRFESEMLTLIEVDEAGLLVDVIHFDPDDTRAVQREAWARWAVIDPIAAPLVELLSDLTDAWNNRDRAGIRARFADDLVVEDHRLVSLGKIEDADAYVESNVVLWNLAPDQRIEYGWSFPAIRADGAVATLRRDGTLIDGGAFESDLIWLCLTKQGRVTRLELFEIDALDAALARFEELTAEPSDRGETA